ncbi:armadillo-type protein [Dichotomocladium elegans]|nr:armadillo-type protein [Dichotomocladium elegans]
MYTSMTRPSRQRLMDYMKIRSQLVQSTSRDFQELVDTLIEEHGALYLALQKTHPVSCALCPAWPSILLYYWQTIVAEGNRLLEQYKTGEAENTNVFQQFLLQGMLLVKDTIKHSSYNVDSSSSDVLSVTDEEKAMAAEARTIMHTQFITPDFVNVCAETLVSKYMLLTPSDMEKWEEEPESWANTIDSENWEFELRPCAEMTFMSLLTQHRDQLCPILLDLAEKVANVSSYEELLFKEAVYAAIGLGVQSIYGRFDFEAFLANRLMPEIFAKGPSLKILHRRIAWLLGKWVNEGISADSRVAIYQGLLELMTREDDMVVRLTAAHSLRLAIDDWDFEIGILLPYLGPAMDLLLQLLNEVTESETIMKLIADINAIADRTGSHMEPYAGKLIELLVPHWSRAQEEPLFQSALVTTFSKIAAILKEQSVQVQGLFLPIVQTCVDRNNKAHVYLLEDALDLWWTMLQTAPANNSQIFSLLPIAIELLDYDTECMRKVIKIIESYLLLDGHGTIQQCGLQLFSGLSVYIGSSKSEVASNISNVIETALQMCPVQTFGGPLVQSGLLGNILNVFLQDKLYAHAIMSYMAIFARLAICDAQFLLEFIQMADREVDSAPGNLLGNVLDKWMDKFDNIGHPRARKLHCIGLTNLLNTHNAAVTARLPNIMAIWIDVLPEVNEAEEDAFLFTEADMQSDLAELDESAEKDRKMIMRREDPVYRSDLVQLIRQTLGACEANMGGSQQFQQAVLSTIDPTLLDQLNKSLTGQ